MVENLALKVKLVVLWLFLEAAVLSHLALEAFQPGMLEEAWADVYIAEELLLLAIILLVPLVMAFLSLTLKDSTNRWANIISGIVLTGLAIFGLIGVLAEPTVYAYAVLLSTAGVVAPALIAWYAWKWPKQEAVTEPKK